MTLFYVMNHFYLDGSGFVQRTSSNLNPIYGRFWTDSPPPSNETMLFIPQIEFHSYRESNKGASTLLWRSPRLLCPVLPLSPLRISRLRPVLRVLLFTYFQQWRNENGERYGTKVAHWTQTGNVVVLATGIYCEVIREPLNHTSDLAEQIIQVESLY